MHTDICDGRVAMGSTPEMMKAVKYHQRSLYGRKVISQITKTGILTSNSESVLGGRIFNGRGDLVFKLLQLIISVAPYPRPGDVPDNASWR